MSGSMPEGYGQGDSGPVGDEGNQSQEVESTTDEGQSESTGYNPNWKEAFDVLPDEYTRNQVKPVFEKWDANNNKRYADLQAQYDPYKELLEHKVDMERIKGAFEFQNRVASNPKEIFEALGAHLNVNPEALKRLFEEEQNQSTDDEDKEDPRLAELRKNQEGMLNWVAQQETARQEAAKKVQEDTWFKETSTALDSLEEKYGKFDRNRVVREALYLAEQKGGEVDFEAGIRSLAELSQTAFEKSPSAKAPNVFSGNGDLASGRVDTKKMSESEFQKYALTEIARINGNSQTLKEK